MSPADTKKTVKELEPRMEVFLAGQGFVFGRKHEWVRRWGWKTDRVRVYACGEISLIINFEVYIPPKNEVEWIPQHVDIIDLGQIYIDPASTFKFPTFHFSSRKFIDMIIQAMPMGIEWLRNFETVELCLENMLTPNVNPNSPAFRYCEKYLRELPEEANQHCCILNLQQEYPDDCARSMFDAHWHGPLVESQE